MNSQPIVVLDACVLYPATLRNLLMWLAVNDLFIPKWSEQIHDEWIRNVLANRPDLKRSQLKRTRQLMDQHAGDCLVVDFEKHINSLKLPDADDRHVLATGIESGAEAIVTWNLSDFPTDVIGKFNIEVVTPDAFLLHLIKSDESLVIASMKEHWNSL
ncbi:MAG: PIN domain-containing protein [Verrucomicrobiales bacterium]|nr:PIN domain-containing protein [Verrucomicrobiales bacterium]